MFTIDTAYKPSRAARILNAHARSTMSGFYHSHTGTRYFQARCRRGALEVFDFDDWTVITEDKANFHDSNGQDIPLY